MAVNTGYPLAEVQFGRRRGQIKKAYELCTAAHQVCDCEDENLSYHVMLTDDATIPARSAPASNALRHAERVETIAVAHGAMREEARLDQ